MLHDVQAGFLADLHVDAIFLGGQRAFDNQDVLPGVLLDGGFECFFSLVAGSGHQTSARPGCEVRRRLSVQPVHS
jgi:hypothetical protein